MWNKRGISLSNNIFKLLERVKYNRIKGTLQFTEAKARARENRAAVDQIFTLRTITQNRTSKGQPTYIAFIDLEKAFDKTWVQGVFFNLWNGGIKSKIWRIMLKLKQNRKTTILTRFGKTKEIDIVHGIGQGIVLSGQMFSALVDETEVELKAVGLGLNYGYLTIAFLLFIDVITMVSKTYKEVKEMIQFVRIICNKWHLTINYWKTKALICNSKECNREAIDIGGKSIEIVRKVKHLGDILTSDLKIKDHIEEKRITTQTILNTCLYTASNEVLSKMRMITIIKLYKSAIIPSLLYGWETWIPTKFNKQNLPNIQLSIIKKIVKAPKSAPKISLYGEIVERPIDFIID